MLDALESLEVEAGATNLGFAPLPDVLAKAGSVVLDSAPFLGLLNEWDLFSSSFSFSFSLCLLFSFSSSLWPHLVHSLSSSACHSRSLSISSRVLLWLRLDLPLPQLEHGISIFLKQSNSAVT